MPAGDKRKHSEGSVNTRGSQQANGDQERHLSDDGTQAKQKRQGAESVRGEPGHRLKREDRGNVDGVSGSGGRKCIMFVHWPSS